MLILCDIFKASQNRIVQTSYQNMFRLGPTEIQCYKNVLSAITDACYTTLVILENLLLAAWHTVLRLTAGPADIV